MRVVVRGCLPWWLGVPRFGLHPATQSPVLFINVPHPRHLGACTHHDKGRDVLKERRFVYDPKGGRAVDEEGRRGGGRRASEGRDSLTEGVDAAGGAGGSQPLQGSQLGSQRRVLRLHLSKVLSDLAQVALRDFGSQGLVLGLQLPLLVFAVPNLHREVDELGKHLA